MKVISWNILRPGFEGAPWETRRLGLREVLRREKPAIFCGQEARAPQLDFLAEVLPGHDHVAVCRDDQGEHSERVPIFFERARFDLLEEGNFWLSDTPDRPSKTWRQRHHRICTWVRLCEKAASAGAPMNAPSDRPAEASAGAGEAEEFLVFNTHFPVVHFRKARRRSAQLVVERIRALAGARPVILTGDFNSTPWGLTWRVFLQAGLTDTERVAGAHRRKFTYHLRGIPILKLDAIFLSGAWAVRDHHVLRDRPGQVFPSDHFGVSAVIERGV